MWAKKIMEEGRKCKKYRRMEWKRGEIENMDRFLLLHHASDMKSEGRSRRTD